MSEVLNVKYYSVLRVRQYCNPPRRGRVTYLSNPAFFMSAIRAKGKRTTLPSQSILKYPDLPVKPTCVLGWWTGTQAHECRHRGNLVLTVNLVESHDSTLGITLGIGEKVLHGTFWPCTLSWKVPIASRTRLEVINSVWKSHTPYYHIR